MPSNNNNDNKNNSNIDNDNNVNNGKYKTWVKLKQSCFNSTYESLQAFGGHCCS